MQNPFQNPLVTPRAQALLPRLGAVLALAAMTALAGLTGCATPAARITVYDFGPGSIAPAMANRMAPLPPVLLAEVEAAAALDSSAVLYRLAYADAQQPRPYAQARWSMPPAQLLRQRLRETLGQHRSVLAPLDAVAPGTLTLRLELEEFSQLFDSAHSSAGLVRVRATLGRSGTPPKPVAQTFFVVQHPASTADAAGGVRALVQASDALIVQLDAWLQHAAAAEAASP